MSDFAAAREHMVNGQLLPNKLTDDAVIKAMSTVPREEFLPKAMRPVAYVDEDLPIAEGRFLMEPMVFARLLQHAHIQPDDAVLDVGCLTGYSSAVLAQLSNVVMALEVDEDMAAHATDVLVEMGADNAVVVTGALDVGYPEQAPFDVIVIEGAVEEVPEALLNQLTPDGRLLAVELVDGVGVASLYTCKDGVKGVRRLFDANIPALPGFERDVAFEF